MRIGLISGEYPPMEGGVGAYTQILAQALSAQNHDVFVLSSVQAQETATRVILSPSVKQWRLGALRQLRRWVREQQLDVVNLQYQTAAFGMSPWIHFIPNLVRAVPIVTTFHDLRYPYLFPKAGRLRDWIVRHLAFASDGVITTNDDDRERLARHPCAAMIPIGSNILHALPETFDPQLWRTSAGASEGDLLLVFFGLVNRSKGLNVLVDALAWLREQDIPARLLIVGGSAGSSDPTNAEYTRQLDEQIARLGMTPFVRSTGFVDEGTVGKFLAAADVAVFPFLDGASFRRGSLMAAIHYGCAIVTTQPQVSVPAFVDGENLLLVPPNDAGALADAILRLRQSPELRAHLQRHARELAGQFDWTQIAHATAAFYQKVVGANA